MARASFRPTALRARTALRRGALAAAGLLAAFAGAAQAPANLRVATEIAVRVEGRTLPTAWGGGLNAPQFSPFDVDDDGRDDLVVYDRSSASTHVFLRTGPADTPRYAYAPALARAFPERGDWALYRDFDGDGLPDLYSYTTAGAGVWKAARAADGSLSFASVTDRLEYVDGASRVPVFISRADLPGIADINGDGDLDLYTFGTFGGFIRYFENLSVENGWGRDSLLFDWVSGCYGLWYEGAACAGGDLGVSCLTGGPAGEDEAQRVHAGSTIAVLDPDFDGTPDLLLGDAGCDNLVLLRNGGTGPGGLITGQDTLWPAYDAPVAMPAFHAAFAVDLDEDGRGDVLAAPNDYGEARTLGQVWAYLDRGGPDSARFVRTDTALLVGDMIDEGAETRPVLFDADADGLPDLVVGYGGRRGDALGTGGLALYRNVGTDSLAAFEHVTSDYAGCSALGRDFLAPTFGDLDGDGDADLVVGDGNGFLHRYENTAGPGAPAAFTLVAFEWDAAAVGEAATPVLFDVNRDGLPDLIVGERFGKLNYWRNFGTPSVAAFTLETTFWGAVDVRSGPLGTGNAVPWLRINELNQLELYVGSLEGTVHRYTNLDGNLLGTFTHADTAYLGLDAGFSAAVWLADLNGDDTLDVLLGGRRGGLQCFTGKGLPDAPPVGLGPSAEGPAPWTLGPNPLPPGATLHWHAPALAGTAYTAEWYGPDGRALARRRFGPGAARASWTPPPGPAGACALVLRPEGGAPLVRQVLRAPAP